MTSPKTFDDVCPKCGGPLRERQAHPYPILLQILFGLNFVIFLFVTTRARTVSGHALWIATIVQIALGALLIRGRLRAQKRILRCIRCNADLP